MTTNNSTIYRAGLDRDRGRSIMDVVVGDDYFRTFGARLIAGRLFDAALRRTTRPCARRAARRPTTSLSIARRRSTWLCQPGGGDRPVARWQRRDDGLIGVVDDLRFRGPRMPVGGVEYRYTSKPFSSPFATIRYQGDPPGSVTSPSDMERMVPTVPFKGRSVEENLYKNITSRRTAREPVHHRRGAGGDDRLYRPVRPRRLRHARRIKEIGIRKTLGASTSDVLRLLIGQFMRPSCSPTSSPGRSPSLLRRRWLGGSTTGSRCRRWSSSGRAGRRRHRHGDDIFAQACASPAPSPPARCATNRGNAPCSRSSPALYRSLARHRLYAILNIGGLALGIAVFLVLFLFVSVRDAVRPLGAGSDRLWMVNSHIALPDYPDGFDNPSTRISSSRSCKANGRRSGRHGSRPKPSASENGQGAVAQELMRVDPSFFRLMPYPAVAGDPVRAMTMANKAAITEAMARTYFGGTANAIGGR